MEHVKSLLCQYKIANKLLKKNSQGFSPEA